MVWRLWSTGEVVVPLAFRHGPAETAFAVAAVAWLVFEFVMRIRQRVLARGSAALDPTYFLLLATIGAGIVVSELLGRHGGLLWPGGVLWPYVAGLVLMVAGLGLASGDVWSLVAVLVPGAFGLAVRIRAEERQLTKALEAEYERFAAGRKRLVP